MSATTKTKAGAKPKGKLASEGKSGALSGKKKVKKCWEKMSEEEKVFLGKIALALNIFHPERAIGTQKEIKKELHAAWMVEPYAEKYQSTGVDAFYTFVTENLR